MIVASQLTRSYQLSQNSIDAVAGVDLHVADGEMIAIIGQSGSGKSTLLNLLAGLDRPSAGSLVVDEKNLHQLSRNEMAEYRMNTIGVIFQSFQLIPHRTAFQNVELPLILKGLTRPDRQRIVNEKLSSVGLLPRSGHFPHQLSGGEQQRVAIARALVNNPKVLLADEPTGNLDSKTAAEVMQLFVTLCRATGATSVIVTHDDQVAKTCSQRQYRMQDGLLTEVTLHASL